MKRMLINSETVRSTSGAERLTMVLRQSVGLSATNSNPELATVTQTEVQKFQVSPEIPGLAQNCSAQWAGRGLVRDASSFCTVS